MKNRISIGVVYVIAGLLIAIGPHTVFKVCEPSKMIMKCYWAANAETGTGIILVIVGILYLLLEQGQAKLAISVLSLVTGVIAILITTVLIGGCEDLTSPCRSYSFPIINTVSALSILVSAGNIAFITRQKMLATSLVETQQ
jgi:hypothetical protein